MLVKLCVMIQRIFIFPGGVISHLVGRRVALMQMPAFVVVVVAAADYNVQTM